MQLPQAPFSYFYPTKIPTSSSPQPTRTSEHAAAHSLLNSSNDQKIINNSALCSSKLTTPLNFSKRESHDATKYDNEIHQKIYNEDDEYRKHSPSHEHVYDKNGKSEDEKNSDENENVEID